MRVVLQTGLENRLAGPTPRLGGTGSVVGPSKDILFVHANAEVVSEGHQTQLHATFLRVLNETTNQSMPAVFATARSDREDRHSAEHSRSRFPPE
jgi:hypothetical protein